MPPPHPQPSQLTGEVGSENELTGVVEKGLGEDLCEISGKVFQVLFTGNQINCLLRYTRKSTQS